MPDVSTPTGAPLSLNALSLSTASATAGSAFSATLSGTTAGSTLKLIDSAGGKYSLSGTTITAPANSLTPGTDVLEVIETFPGAFGSPKASLFQIQVAAIALGAPALATSSGTPGTAFSSAITGAAAGSILSILNDRSGRYALNGSTLTAPGGPSQFGDVVTIRERNPFSGTFQDVQIIIKGPGVPGSGGVTPVVPALLQGFRTATGLSTVLAAMAMPAFAIAQAQPAGKQVVVDANSVVNSRPFLGVGAAITDSTASVLMGMPAAARASILQEAFGTNGLSLVRVCMTDSDYTTRYASGGFTTRDDASGDTAMSGVASGVANADLPQIIPLVKQILAINPNVRVTAAPWSPPAWLKSGSSPVLAGGSINATAANLQAYANYFVNWIAAWQAQGVPIYAVSAQNEPNTGNTAYPTCIWTGAQLNTFIKSYLAPALSTAGLTTKVWGGDASWGDELAGGYAQAALYDATTRGLIDGSAYHGYDGSAPGEVLPQAYLAAQYPTKSNHMTECSYNMHGSNSQSYFPNYTPSLGDAVYSAGRFTAMWRAMGQSMIWWNLALNTTGQPGPGDYLNAPLIIDGSGNVYRQFEYYLLVHFARYVQRGAVQVASSAYALDETFGGADIISTSWLNPDGSLVSFIANMSASSQVVSIVDAAAANATTQVTLASGDWTTIQWKNPTAVAAAPQTPLVNLGGVNNAITVALATIFAPANGGSPITGYNIYSGGSKVASNVALPYSLPGANGTAQSIMVSAVNAVGESPLSTAQSITPVATPAHGVTIATGTGSVYALAPPNGSCNEPTDGYIDVACMVSLPSVTANTYSLMSKFGTSSSGNSQQNSSWGVYISGGYLNFQAFDSGAANFRDYYAQLPAAIPANTPVWIRVQANLSSTAKAGVPATSVVYSYSLDGVTYTAFTGSQPTVAGGISQCNVNQPMRCGGGQNGNSTTAAFTFYKGLVRASSGKVLAAPDLTVLPTGFNGLFLDGANQDAQNVWFTNGKAIS